MADIKKGFWPGNVLHSPRADVSFESVGYLDPLGNYVGQSTDRFNSYGHYVVVFEGSTWVLLGMTELDGNGNRKGFWSFEHAANSASFNTTEGTRNLNNAAVKKFEEYLNVREPLTVTYGDLKITYQ